MTLPALVVLALIGLALGWFFLAGRDDAPAPTAHRRPRADVDYGELEEAEREVRDAPDEDEIRDWGPGTAGPPMG